MSREGVRLTLTLTLVALVTWRTLTHTAAWWDGFCMGAVVVNGVHLLINWNEPKRVRNDR